MLPHTAARAAAGSFGSLISAGVAATISGARVVGSVLAWTRTCCRGEDG